jgi:hypothetical protein
MCSSTYSEIMLRKEAQIWVAAFKIEQEKTNIIRWDSF